MNPQTPAEYTPGPWKSQRVEHQYGCYGYEITQKWEHQGHLAGVQKVGRLAFIPTDDPQDKANANLIASVPDLLDALQDTIRLLALLHAPEMNDPIAAACHKARAAIAKATQ